MVVDAVTQRERELLAVESGRQMERMRGSGGAVARFTTRLLKDDRGQATLDVPSGPDQALALVAEALPAIAQLVTDHPAVDPPEVWAIVGVSYKYLSPAVVRVAAESRGQKMSRLTIRAVTKTRKCGTQAAERVRTLLQTTFTHSPEM